jgi:protein-S-isoprenylcysteine O-methyltransferase Ste14
MDRLTLPRVTTAPPERRLAGAFLAMAWNVAALLPVNVLAIRMGWWRFGTGILAVSGVPAGLWVGWAVLWGAAPVLATKRRRTAVVAAVLGPLAALLWGHPVVIREGAWIVGVAVAVAVALVPGLLLGRWTAEQERLAARAALQAVGFGALMFFVLPSLVFALTGEGWGALLARPRWQLVAAAMAVSPAAAMAVRAVGEFVAHGGTPVPFDPPARLATTGPYAYVANPMQLSITLLLVAWGALLASAGLVVAAALATAFLAGPAHRYEEGEMADRFGEAWHAYRRDVRMWWPRLRPLAGPRAEGAP